MLAILFLISVITSGAIGFFLAYLKYEKKEKEKLNKKRRNPKSGWYL